MLVLILCNVVYAEFLFWNLMGNCEDLWIVLNRRNRDNFLTKITTVYLIPRRLVILIKVRHDDR